MIRLRKLEEIRDLLRDRHNNAEVINNFDKINSARNWIHSHKWFHLFYKRIIYGLVKRNFRYITGPLRVLPDFIIIGCQKCATTSLYDYMIQHPNIFSASEKEIHYFDSNYNVGITWYRSFFPTIFQKKFLQYRKQKFTSGEASPMYIFNSVAAKRISELLPQVKLIAILRNPVDRAYSHYNMQVKNGYESLSFEDALAIEEKRIAGEREKELQNENYVGINLRDFSYLSRGIYIDQLEHWMKYFNRKQFLILTTEELEDNPINTMNKIFEFLDLPSYEIKNLKRMNVGEYKIMSHETRKMLIEYFKPYNERLYKFLGINLDWDK